MVESDLKEIAIRSLPLYDRVAIAKTDDSTTSENAVFKRWSSSVFKNYDDLLHSRLKLEEIKLAEVNNLNSPSANSAISIANKSWLPYFREGLKVLNQTTYEREGVLYQRYSDLCDSSPYCALYLPWIDVAYNKVWEKASTKNRNRIHSDAWRGLMQFLAHRFCQVLSPAVHKFRNTHYSQNNPIKEDYEQFITEMYDGGIEFIFKKYPVISRLIGTLTGQWISAIELFLKRLDSDWNAITKTFHPRTPKHITRINAPETSDIHEKGQTVLFIEFDRKNQVVYKPRSTQVESAFSSFIQWTHDFDIDTKLRSVNSLARSNYGWSEYISHKVCVNNKEAKTFYRQAGMLAAIGYVFGSYDLHYDNIVACGTNPILVDLDTLFAVNFKDPSQDNDSRLKETQSTSSVLKTHLIPFEEQRSNSIVDSTALGCVFPQASDVHK